ncbi:DNA-binding protein [Paenibacillus sp. JMULE4]|uniref:helix-turn-helix domain-containing protein n=1 Tax=Paenibacillus sp. JMULE4 TaxID=2518342 RepID=UPI001576835C|nr:helix-turn-helix domain-containing protein [Paenibacillus sp. JMULE4]NTZ20970.1 DNA-binding protein [Paenibacillus sp. JMULE4]
MFHDYDDIITVEELLEMLQIGRNTAYRLLGTGQIKSVRIGRKYRIPRESVIEYIFQKCRC